MALAKMREIAAQLYEKYRIHRVAIVHRLGRLEIGETSVFIAVSAPHRAAAFDACRFAIDTLKRPVQIWKKEYFEDGAVWADGQLPPVPAATPRAKPASYPPMPMTPLRPQSTLFVVSALLLAGVAFNQDKPDRPPWAQKRKST